MGGPHEIHCSTISPGAVFVTDARRTYISRVLDSVSELLDALAKTPADRTNLLSGYFEPSAEDLEKGLKAPALAHKSIARMVANGYIRVILTTNFDRLLDSPRDPPG